MNPCKTCLGKDVTIIIEREYACSEDYVFIIATCLSCEDSTMEVYVDSKEESIEDTLSEVIEEWNKPR